MITVSPRVLMYHGFCDRPRDHDPFSLFVTADAFRHQLEYLLASGRRPLDLTAYLQTRQSGRSPVGSFLVTIDDGFCSVADIAAPLLSSAGVPAVLFVPPARIGGTSAWMPEMPDEPILTADQLRGLAQHGIELGVHGLDHLDVVGLSDAELHRHVVESRELLSDLTGVRARSFAYPRGRHDQRAAAAVRGAGYEVAFAVFSGRGPFAIPRIDITAVDSLTTVRLKLVPGYRQAWRMAGHFPAARRFARRAVAGRQRRRSSPTGTRS